MQVKKLLDADKANGGDGTQLRNGVLGTDIELPVIGYKTTVYEFGDGYKEYLSNLMWLKDANDNVKFTMDAIQSWWSIDTDAMLYNNTPDNYGANSTIDVGMGAGPTKDNYAVVVRGGVVLDLIQGTTGVNSDVPNQVEGIGFRAAFAYEEE